MLRTSVVVSVSINLAILSKPKKNVNAAVVKWFSSVRNQNLSVSGPILKQKALQFAKSLGDETFKASDGWLGKFKKRHDVSQKKACGESAAVNEEQIFWQIIM